MPNCDLDDCSLKDSIDDIKKNQAAMTKANTDNAVATGKFVQKMDDFLEQYEKNEESNKEERDILFTRTRGTIKWLHLLWALGGISTFMGIIWGAIKMSGGG